MASAAGAKVPNMFLNTARRKAATTRLESITRQFSTTRPMAFEVKRLGVVGAGQMVRTSRQKIFVPFLTFLRASE